MSRSQNLANRVLKRVGLVLHRWPTPRTVERHLRDMLRDLQVDAVIDVGANRGQFARSLREVGYAGWILSVEPNPDVFRLLAEAAEGDPKWNVYQTAVGAEAGELTLHVGSADDFASALPTNAFARERFGDVVDETHTVVVPVQRLDDWLPPLQAALGFRLAFLKLDTQGYDLEALRGAAGILNSVAGLITEVSFRPIYDGMPDVTESLAAIRAAGFAVTDLFPVATDYDGTLIEMDCVARRRP